MSTYRLFASKACGSAIVEMALELCGLDYECEWLPYLEPGPERDRLLALNVTGQVPTLILPDGTVMSESAAIVLHLAEHHPEAGLAPAPDAPGRAAFLRWLVFLVAQVYPSFNYGDDPGKWVSGDAAGDEMRRSIDDYRLSLWDFLEQAAEGGPWVLGPAMTALDLYIAVMRNWRPGKDAFDRRFPRLAAAADTAARHPVVAQVLARNF